MTSHHHVVARATASITLVASLLLGAAEAAEAQTPAAGLASPRESFSRQSLAPPLLTEPDRASIEREAHVATALYVVSAIGLGVSAVLELTAMFMVLDDSPEPLLGPDLGGLKTFELLGALGGVVGGIGIIALPIAIGLHVDSHSRRDALERCPCARVSLTPGGLSVSGSF